MGEGMRGWGGKEKVGKEGGKEGRRGKEREGEGRRGVEEEGREKGENRFQRKGNKIFIPFHLPPSLLFLSPQPFPLHRNHPSSTPPPPTLPTPTFSSFSLLSLHPPFSSTRILSDILSLLSSPISSLFFSHAFGNQDLPCNFLKRNVAWTGIVEGSLVGCCCVSCAHWVCCCCVHWGLPVDDACRQQKIHQRSQSRPCFPGTPTQVGVESVSVWEGVGVWGCGRVLEGGGEVCVWSVGEGKRVRREGREREEDEDEDEVVEKF